MATTEHAAVWQGRLAAPLDPRAQRLNDSLPVDRRLWPEELALTRAYSAALVEAGVLAESDAEALVAAAGALERDLATGTVTLEGEDVHSAVESALAARCGDPARRLHTGRSRNDQVATLFRMRVMLLCDRTVEHLRELARALLVQARRAGDTAVAAYTHLQPAQPVLLAHWWLAHLEAFERDEERFLSARENADRLPLGAGAIAGSPLEYDRAALATRLGFSRLAANSLDAVGDRDFALEYLQAAAQLGVHLSRLAEDLVLWCSPGFGWYRAPDGFSTGSSLLPQKRNPDLFELARGKSGRLIANAERLAILLKGLPSGYQKDLQEDKEAVFDTADTLSALLDALPPAIVALSPQPERMRATLTPDLLAVELADALVAEGVPFREAHAAVGRLWAAAEAAGVEPAALPDETRLALSPHFTAGRIASLSFESALARRDHAPGAGPGSVAIQIARHQARLGVGVGLDMDAGNGSARRAARDARIVAPAAASHPLTLADADTLANGITLRRATLADVPGIAGVMADYVVEGTLLPRSVAELYQCIREFHVAERDGRIVACAALRLLWNDLGEVRSLAVHPDHHGQGLGGALVGRVVEDARALGLPRMIALTREVAFFERCGFTVVSRDTLPRKVWTDCVRCPRRHACDEVAVVFDLVPGASEAAAASGRSWITPIPLPAAVEASALPIIS
jgi:argininosuccinate lyase/amino-acid N-acetyltransferase